MSTKLKRTKNTYLKRTLCKSGWVCLEFNDLHKFRWWKRRIKEEEGRDDTLDCIRTRVLDEDAPAPDIVDVKDSLRFYTKQSKGRIAGRKHASVE